MNGVDWKAMRDKYAALIPFVNHRNDLTYLLGELIGELNSGHTYVAGGERPDTPRVKLGLLARNFRAIPRRKLTRSIASCPAKTGTSTRAHRSRPWA